MDLRQRETLRSQLGLDGRRVMAYVGGLGGWYLTDKVAEFLAAAHKINPSTFTMVLTQSRESYITEPLRAAGVSSADYLVRKVSPSEVRLYLEAADLGLSFRSGQSKIAASPTKIGEYLAAGLPVVSNSGVGDVDELIDRDRVGVVLNGFSRTHT